MAIRETSPLGRTDVLWVSEEASTDTQALLVSLGFSVKREYPAALLKNFGSFEDVAAAIFVQPETKPTQFIEEIKDHVEQLLNYESLVFIISSKSGSSSIGTRLAQLKLPAVWQGVEGGYKVFDGLNLQPYLKNGEPPFPYVYVFSPYTMKNDIETLVADRLLRYGSRIKPKPDREGVFDIIGPDSKSLDLDERLMLRRGFHDYAKLHIQKFSEGNSEANVFLVHATLEPSVIAPFPQPFFVKIGPRNQIFHEWRNYKFLVREHLPFHLAPNLALDRCGLGAKKGIIVGDFIEESEGIGSCSRNARASASIGALFDRTLRGWHSNIEHGLFFSNQKKNKRVFNHIPGGRLIIAKEHGAQRNPSELDAELKIRLNKPLLCGWIHGDLHAGNIFARGNDAILIDFLSSKKGPLLADPAALEASLIIRVPADANFNREAWQRALHPLIIQESFDRLPSVIDPTEPYAWMVSAIRQIRRYALAIQTERGQYATVLAYRLLQMAAKDKKAPEAENFRRAVAYALADSLLQMKWS